MNLHVSHVLGTVRIMSPQFWAGLGVGLLVGLLFVLGNYIARRRQ